MNISNERNIMEIVENNNKVLRFGELKTGDVFTTPMSNIPMMKTETMNFEDSNAVILRNGHLEYFGDNDEVISKRAKLVIDN